MKPLPTKMPSQVNDGTVVKIAVTSQFGQPQLIEFDQQQPLTTIIATLCCGWNVTDPENYALQFSSDNPNLVQFVNEKNRKEVKNGTVLELRHSPAKTTKDILFKLRDESNNGRVDALKELMVLSSDQTFSYEFINQKGNPLLISAIEKGDWSEEMLSYALPALVELLENGGVHYANLSDSFVSRNIEFIKKASTISAKDVISSALNILENIVQSSAKNSLVEKEFVNDLDCLVALLADHYPPTIHQNTLALINALFIKSDDTTKKTIYDKFIKRDRRNALLRIVNMPKLSQDVAHQLYVYQTLTLGLLKQRMSASVPNEQQVSDQIKQLRKIAFEGDTNETHDNKTYYKKLGFKCDFNPVQDFMEGVPGLLALECMTYFALRYEQNYKKVVHESSVRMEQHDMPFGRASIELIKVLVEVLRIGQPPEEQGQDIQPIFFGHDFPFEELFCTCIMTLNRTWKDMRATIEDFPKVFSVVREQVIRTLNCHPKNMGEFSSKINTFSYANITKLRQQERDSREEVESTAPAIVNLKQKIEPEIMELIKQQRLQIMMIGAKFSRPRKKQCYLRLSPNHKVLHYTEYDDKSGQTIPNLDDMKEQFQVNEIRMILKGKECPSAKQHKTRFIFAFTLDLNQPTTEEFITTDEATYNNWVDGLNVLLNQRPESKAVQEEFEMLLSMEIKLRLLDTEGIDISKEPPPIPDEPDNYNFCFES